MDLDRLIESERRNDAIVGQARTEAAALVARARATAQQRRDALAQDADRLVAEHAAQLKGALASRSAAIDHEADAGAARYGAVTDQQIAAILPTLLALLLQGGAA